VAEAGITDLDRYRAAPEGELALDLFVDQWPETQTSPRSRPLTSPA
jgi:hypothetical protein